MRFFWNKVYNEFKSEPMDVIAAVHDKNVQYNKSSVGKKHYCAIHGDGNHATRDCYKIKKLREKSENRKKKPRVASVVQELETKSSIRRARAYRQ